jgi:RHS repeat-associated protein
VRALVDNTGVIRNRYEYDAFGGLNSAMAGATDDSRYRYTGREFDAETGLYYYRARYFDTNSGRFIGQDPIGFASGDGSNLYSYVKNRPVDRVDPLGLFGVVEDQTRAITYEDRNGQHLVADIDIVIGARINDPDLRIQSDRTIALIAYSSTNQGSLANRSLVPDLRSDDDAGHIIGRQLGGSGTNANNLFAQARSGYNRSPSPWRAFEDSVRRNIDSLFEYPPAVCPSNYIHPRAVITVELQYSGQIGAAESLRPVEVFAGVLYSPPSIPAHTPPVNIPNP